MELIGRSRELDYLSGLIAQALEGSSAAVVLKGEAGVGKTAILDAVMDAAVTAGMTAVRLTGVQAEAPLGYAALQQLLLHFPGFEDRLPSPQRDALQVALGMISGPPPSRFLVGLAVLTLIADVASEAPLLVMFDDANWQDAETASILGFVARRLQAEGIVLLFAVPDANSRPELAGIGEFKIERLGREDAVRLFSLVGGPHVSPEVQARVVDECQGNPLALVELARELMPDQLAGRIPLPDAMYAAGSLPQRFVREINGLAPDARLLLRIAAAEPRASEQVVWRAAGRLGISAEIVAPQLEGIVEFSAEVEFRHPLLRSVAYRSTPSSERRRIHAALAEALDSPDRAHEAAWHLAMAATGPNEVAAERLAWAANGARDRGGYAAAADFLAKAVDLTGDDNVRTNRVLDASEVALLAGRPAQAQELLAQLRPAQSDSRQRALAERLRGEAAFAAGATEEAASALLAASRSLTSIDPDLGLNTLLQALIAANYTGRNALAALRDLGMEILGSRAPSDAPKTVENQFLFGFLYRLAGQPGNAARLLASALAELERAEATSPIRAAIPAIVPGMAGAELMREEASQPAMRSYVEFARRSGAVMLLPVALSVQANAYIRHGRFEDAEVAYSEAQQLGAATGAPGSPNLPTQMELLVRCWRGQETEARALAAELQATASGGRKDGVAERGVYRGHLHLPVLELGLGRYRAAFRLAYPIFDDDLLVFGTVVLSDLIEAAVRCDEVDVATRGLRRLDERATAGGGRWGLGLLSRGRALLAYDDNAAEDFYRASIDQLAPADLIPELARSHLLFGEWLRRRRRRREARFQLDTAYNLFADLGAAAFAARTRRELDATGGSVRKRSVETSTTLTAQELHVAQLVASGDNNREVAAKLYISAATVEHHLERVYQKLGISSRVELTRLMLSGTP